MHLPFSNFARATVILFAAAFTFTAEGSPVFDESSFSQLRFLEGRWKGVGPDGKEFFEEYVLVEPTLFKSMRHADSSFTKIIDGSTVALKDGVAISTWDQFTWKASSITSKKACFEPISAPSSFCWELTSPDTVVVTQRWSGEDGKENAYSLELNRFSQ